MKKITTTKSKEKWETEKKKNYVRLVSQTKNYVTIRMLNQNSLPNGSDKEILMERVHAE